MPRWSNLTSEILLHPGPFFRTLALWFPGCFASCRQRTSRLPAVVSNTCEIEILTRMRIPNGSYQDDFHLGCVRCTFVKIPCHLCRIGSGVHKTHLVLLHARNTESTHPVHDSCVAPCEKRQFPFRASSVAVMDGRTRGGPTGRARAQGHLPAWSPGRVNRCPAGPVGPGAAPPGQGRPDVLYFGFSHSAKIVDTGSKTFSHWGCVKDFAAGGKTTLVFSM